LKDLASAAPTLLNDLYERATDPTGWPVFLEKVAALLRSDTGSLRLTGLCDPVVYHSHTIGFHHRINEHYEAEAVELDPFREALAAAPLGKVLDSTSVISDQAFSRSEHYRTVFRPNGNFYACGAQFERENGRGMHIGIHRPKHRGPFSRDECKALETFSPHLRRVIQLSGLLTNLNRALKDTGSALDLLPFGVWHMDGRLRVSWANAAAEEAFAANTYGLALKNNRLVAESGSPTGTLRDMIRRLAANQSVTESLKLGQTSACLVMTQSHQDDHGFHIGRPSEPGILCFLLDAARPAELDQHRLRTMYRLTVAEYRLASLLVRGLDVTEACAALQISPHTGRTQLKSIMQKTGDSRQAALQRTLLLCADTLRKTDE